MGVFDAVPVMKRLSRFGLLLMLGLSASAQEAGPPPQFTAAGVVRGLNSARIVPPGSGLSIYGRFLGPTVACSGAADPKRLEIPNPRGPSRGLTGIPTYPDELCGTQVLIGGKPAGLLYVQDRQINLKVPEDAPEGGEVEIRVVRLGQSSAPVEIKAGFEKTTVSLEQPAYTDMPVWLKVELPLESGAVHYPSSWGPAFFGCSEVEARKDGKPLAMLPGSNNWMRYVGASPSNFCGGWGPNPPSHHQGRLPLHLLYRFATPGTYEVRFTLWNHLEDSPYNPKEIRARSDWSPIEVLPAAPNQRSAWLERLRKNPPADAGELLSDALPSLLGFPDEASFEILTAYLYNPDESVRRYATYGLSYWPEDFASNRLLALLHAKGPSDAVIRFLIRQPGFSEAHSGEIVEASLPFLAADSPVLLGGAVNALRLASSDNPAIRDAVLRSAEHVVSRADSQTGSDLAQMIAATKDARAHAVLRTLLGEGYNQVAYALLSFRDPADLPGLCALLAGPGGASLPEEMYRSYGDAAVPYFERALSGAPGRFTAEHIARQLMAISDPAGFEFAARSIEEKGVSRSDMIQALKSQFPELNSANDDAIAAFARKRAGTAQ